MIALTKDVLGLPDVEDPVLDLGQSVLAAEQFSPSFLNSGRKGVILPPDAIIKATWDSVFRPLSSVSSGGGSSKTVKIPAFKKRHKEQYRWPEQEFVRHGKPQEVHGAVATYISSGLRKGRQGQFFPRQLFTEEKNADNSLREVDHAVRTSHRVVSHCSYFLAGLSAVGSL
jgi:hypothetical protein